MPVHKDKNGEVSINPKDATFYLLVATRRLHQKSLLDMVERSTRKAPVPSVPLLDRRTTDFFLIASPLKMGRIEPALRTEVQHAQIHRLVSVGHRLLCEKIPSAKTVASNH